MLSRDTRDSLLAVVVVAVPVTLWFLLDEDVLLKLALGALGLGVAVVLSVRKYLDRLDQATLALPQSVEGGRSFDQDTLSLKPFERQMLGIQDIAHPERIRRQLAARRKQLESVAMGFAGCALIALIALIVIFAD